MIRNLEHVEVLLGDPREVFGCSPWKPFDHRVVDFLADFSRVALALPRETTSSDVYALAYWCRRANLLRLSQSIGESEIRKGIGVVFHVPPANVPLNFFYSLVIGLLSGNSNLLRLSSRDFAEVDLVIQLLHQVLNDPSHEEIRKRVCVVRYGHDDGVSGEISRLVDGRIIWGGDRTVESIRSLPGKPRLVDVPMADRVSFALIRSSSVVEASRDEILRLAELFLRDVTTFDQNACSSPKMLVWVGSSQDTDAAKERFWYAIQEHVSAKDFLQPIRTVDRLVELCEATANDDSIVAEARVIGPFVRLSLANESDWPAAGAFRFGTVVETTVETLSRVARLSSEKVQTVSSYGFPSAELVELARADELMGIDRFVPFGQALDFDLVWDGFDLIRMLSRHVVVAV